ncbi:ABC transporter ATP-binding protein [uncultured Clostridium sp.]|uniref:ABC transporter ATP-binding protein n=1 Tax=uncultured Clostridium sp. TaxID=59620 RepID=UPI0026741111|nr:ABC transporter ATP-binding protein [uncultured Clostridium sp.]
MNWKKLINIHDLKEFFIKIKWILSHAKPVIPFLIFTTVISSASSLISVYNTLISKSLIDNAIGGNTSQVIKYLIIMISITLGMMLLNPITSLLSTHASTKLNQNIQNKMFEHIEYSSWLEQSKFHSVSLLTRITSDVATISSTLLSTIPNIISILVTLLASFSTLIYLAPSIAIIAIFIGPFLVLVSRYFSKKLKDLYKKAQEEDVKYRAFIQESVQNIMIVKTFCMEKINMDRLIQIQNNKYNIAMKNTKLSAMTGLAMSLCSNLAYFTIFCWGALNISTGVTTYGTFTAMLQLYGKVQSPFSSLASMFPGLISTIAAAERLMELEEIPLEKSSEKEVIDFINPEITFEDVSFEYKKGIKIINDINLTIPYGETIAFVGPSGEGKTTLIRLILALINPSSGKVYLKENNKKDSFNRDYRNLISYVPQGNTLFSGTIEDNLRYGNFEATEEEIYEALKNACALDFVNELENGIKTVIGEKATGISEGQAQRIAIARSFLRKKPILILDEATSALDPETEVSVLKSVKSLPHKPTCIIITHRPSALNICHRIIRLEKGHLKQVSKESILEVATELV